MPFWCARIGLTSKKVDIISLCECSIECRTDDIRYIYERSASNVIEVKIDGKKSYVRPIRIHLRNREFIDEMIDEFNELVLGQDAGCVVEKECIKDVNRFLSMGNLNAEGSAFLKYAEAGDYSILGMDKKICRKNVSIYNRFLLFAISEIYSYRMNSFVGYGGYETYFASRFMAESFVAKKLGKGEMFPECRFIELRIGARRILGLQVAAVEGVIKLNRDGNLQLVDWIANEKILDELNVLNVIDVLCNEKDHKPENYSIMSDNNGNAFGICAFDNDSPNSFFISSRVNMQSYLGSSSMFLDNQINRAYLNGTFMDAIISANTESFSELSLYLNKYQYRAFLKRLKLIRDIFVVAREENQFIVESVRECVYEELSGKYGDTYIAILKKWICGEYNDLINKNDSIVDALLGE